MLVTASHVYRDYAKHKEAFGGRLELMVTGESGAEPIPLGGQPYYTPEIDPRTQMPDPADLAFWDLCKETADRLSTRTFLNRTHLDLKADLSRGVYYLIGFPQEWSKHDPTDPTKYMQSAVQLISHPFDAPTEVPGFDSRFHVLLNCKRSDISNVDLQQVPFPEELQGISGCAIWRICGEEGVQRPIP